MSDAYGSFGNPYGVPPPFPNQPPPPPPPPGPPLSSWQPPARDRRPGVVTTGAVLAIVLSSIALLICLVGVLGVVAAHGDPDPDTHLTTGDMVAGLVVCGAMIAASALAIVLAGLALARRQWARIMLVVLGFVAFAGVLPIVTSVLLLLPPAGRWYAGRRAASVLTPSDRWHPAAPPPPR